MNNLHKGASSKLFEFAKVNRKKQTPAEKILWDALRNRKLEGHKFRRQHPISQFIADFYCHESSLIVEVDGGYHSGKEQAEIDEGRTQELKEIGLKVIRFKNEDVINELDWVKLKILKHIKHDASPKEMQEKSSP